MVLFFTATLGFSMLAMILLLVVKRYELVSGRVVFAGARPGLNSFFETISRWTHGTLPSLLRQYIERLVRFVLTKLQLLLAQVILMLEHGLERILHAVRERTGDQYVDREPSAFLREVADHKKNLLYKKGLKKEE